MEAKHRLAPRHHYNSIGKITGLLGIRSCWTRRAFATFNTWFQIGCRSPSGALDHAKLMSLVDPRGMLRLQHPGLRFDPNEIRRDFLGLVETPGLAGNQ